MRYSLQPETLARLDHRMQFVLGPRYYLGFDNWLRSEVAGGLYLTSHPDLNVTTVASGPVTLSLLGYILDPAAPESNDSTILSRLASAVAGGGDLFSELEPYGGRYLLVVAAGETLIVGDPVGTMQLNYTFEAGALWGASQPHLLGKILDRRPDPEALAYLKWLQGVTDEPSWPVDRTHLEDVTRLVPNHYLDIDGQRAVRYWPREPRVDGVTDELRRQITARLQGLLAAAAQRFDLAIGVSAGYDSRVVLAASRRVAHEVRYYTGQGGHRGARHPDVAVPKAMLADLSLEHDLIVTRAAASPEFAEVFQRSISFSHAKREAGQQTQLEQYRLGRVAVLGNASEIARNHLRTSNRAPPLVGWPTAEHLGLLMAMSHPFALRQFQRWLDSVGDTRGYDVLDLFFWEHRHGSWFSQNCSQFMTGWQDVFVPFNCRRLLIDMLSVPLAAREDRGVRFYVSLARQLWPEVLEYPINPTSKTAQLRALAYRSLANIKRVLLPKGRQLRPAHVGKSTVQDGTNRLT